jgi:spore coat polysaccharide biosynthesis protein SpsF
LTDINKHTDKNIVIVVQARRGSTRLPGKIMMPLVGAPLLVRMVERVQAAKTPVKVVVATTIESIDDKVEELCKEYGIECFRGHPTDLLDRHYKAGEVYNADIVVKIPSDVPLIDPKVIDKVLQYYLNNEDKYDFVSNLHPATYPDGNDVEVMPMDILETAYNEALKEMEREHTTPFIWENPKRFRIGNVEWDTGKDYSMSHRFTIDYPEDYEFIKRVYDELYDKNTEFGLDEILNLLNEKPEIYDINKKYAGVNWYRNYLDELKTVTKEQTKSI